MWPQSLRNRNFRWLFEFSVGKGACIESDLLLFLLYLSLLTVSAEHSLIWRLPLDIFIYYFYKLRISVYRFSVGIGARLRSYLLDLSSFTVLAEQRLLWWMLLDIFRHTSTIFITLEVYELTFNTSVGCWSSVFIRKKRRDLTQSYDKSPYTNRNVKRAKWQHKQRHKKVRLHSGCRPT